MLCYAVSMGVYVCAFACVHGRGCMPVCMYAMELHLRGMLQVCTHKKARLITQKALVMLQAVQGRRTARLGKSGHCK